MVDTNNSPAGVDYVIPGNDDSSRAVKLYAREIADAIIAGQKKAVEEVLDGDHGDKWRRIRRGRF